MPSKRGTAMQKRRIQKKKMRMTVLRMRLLSGGSAWPLAVQQAAAKQAGLWATGFAEMGLLTL
jgi:hypothetical protein